LDITSEGTSMNKILIRLLTAGTKNRQTWSLSTLLAAALVASGCSSLRNDSQIEADNEIASYYQTSSDELIANDLLSAMSKIDGFEPAQTTVQTKAPESTFDFALLSALEDLGYATRIVDRVEGNNLLTHTTQSLPDEEYRVHRKYTLNFRNISLERSYLFDLQDVKTGSKLMVAGALPIEHTPPDTLLETNEVDEAESNPATFTNASENSFGSLRQKRNVMEIGVSNYSKILGQREEIKKAVLVFENDSMVIGDDNKEEIRNFVNQFNPDRDIFSVIGCSHGSTSIPNGNAILATGRAQRVKEELLFAGIPENRILDEGCWDPVLADEKMPIRGVVLTLNRRS